MAEKNTDAALEVSEQAEYKRLLLEAPIGELANYAGVDLDTAVKMRVDAALQAADARMEMDIVVRPIMEPQSNLHGFASVTWGGITVHDFKIVESKDGDLFVGMPSKPDKNSKTGYRNTVYVDKDIKDDFDAAVINKFHEAVKQKEREQAAPDAQKKTGMKGRMAAAAKEAAEHNASRPAPAKGGKDKNAEH